MVDQFGGLEIDADEFGGIPVRKGDLDPTTGAPARVRSAIASAPVGDKLEALRKFYPDARQEEDNYVFTNPETGRPTRFNPEGFDVGDIAEYGRVGAELIGGAIGGGGALLAGQLGPQIATPEEAITVPLGVGLGAAIGGGIYDLTARGIYGIADSRDALEKVASSTASVVMNAAGQKLGEIAEKGIRAGVSAGGRLVGKTSEEIRDAFQRIGADPLAGAVSGSRTIQGIEQALAKLPLSADVIGSKYANTINQMDDFVKRIASRITKKEGTESVGRAVQRGVESFKIKFQTQAGDLYDQLWRKLPENTRVPIDNFRAALDRSIGQFSDDPAFQGLLDSPSIKRLAEAAEGTDSVTVRTLKALRTKIGRELDDKAILSDSTNAELKQLYGALSDDIRLAAEGAEATAEFNRANNYWAAGRARIDEVLRPIVQSGSADKIYNKVFGPEGQALKSTTSTIRSLVKSIPKEDSQVMAAEFVRRMGQSTPGQAGFDGAASFSPARFLTQYNKMPDGAKSAVFNTVPGLRASMDDLAKVSAAIKDTHAMTNSSGTAGQLMFMSLLTGGVGGAYGGSEGAAVGVGAVLSPYAAAKLMASPKFVNWLADAGKVAVDANSIGAHMARLGVIAESSPEIEEEIYQYSEAMRDSLPVFEEKK